jgi:photosystem II stability/assembly factor-like uncharacterized protein
VPGVVGIARVLVTGAMLVVVSGCVGSNWSGARVSAAVALKQPAIGFNPLSFTAVSDSDYWLLGSVRCGKRRCNAILRTTDGGRSFARVNVPRLPSVDGAPITPTLRFADVRDGYLFTGGVRGCFYSTHDGGATWHRLALRSVLGFATGSGNAYLVTARCSLDRCSAYRFERSPVSTDDWRAQPMPFPLGTSIVDLAAHGLNVWLLGTPRGGENGSGSDRLARSRDGGRTFAVTSGPCLPGLGGDIAPTSARVVWAACPTGMLAGGWRSTDGGATFERLRTPTMVNSAALAPASGTTAVLARNGARTPLLRTTDAGATWSAVSAPGTTIFVPWIGFTDARVGAALVQTGWNAAAKFERQALWRTADGGAHWSRVSLP